MELRQGRVLFPNPLAQLPCGPVQIFVSQPWDGHSQASKSPAGRQGAAQGPGEKRVRKLTTNSKKQRKDCAKQKNRLSSVFFLFKRYHFFPSDRDANIFVELAVL